MFYKESVEKLTMLAFLALRPWEWQLVLYLVAVDRKARAVSDKTNASLILFGGYHA